MNGKPLSPAEFIAVCERLRPGIPLHQIDAAYASLGAYQPPPDTPWMATSMVVFALQQVGVTDLQVR